MKEYNYGIKIYPRDLNDSAVLAKIDSFTKKHKMPVEIAFQDIDFSNVYGLVQNNSHNRYIYHLDFSRLDLSIYMKSNNIENLKEDFIKIKEIKPIKVVLHLDNSIPFGLFTNPAIEQYHVQSAVDLLSKIQERIGKDITICIENTFSPINFYKKVIEAAIESKLNVGLTFDIGHAKIWSPNSFVEWDNFLSELYIKNTPMHFHIHNNNGIQDLHRTIFSPLQDFKEDWSEESILNASKGLIHKYPNATFVFEFNVHDVIEHWDTIESSHS